MIALASLAALALMAQDVPLVPVVVELEGPLEVSNIEVSSGPGVPVTRVEIELALGAGERRSVVVPAAAGAPDEARTERPVLTRSDGVGALPPLVGDPRDHRRRDLLRARAMPPVAPGRGPTRPSMAVLALLAAAIPLGIGLRRRPAVQLAAGVGLAGVLAFVARPQDAPDTPPVRLLEAGLGSEPEVWTVREVRSGRVGVPALEADGGRWADGLGVALLSPSGAPPEVLDVVWRDGGWELDLPRGGVLFERSVDVGMRLLRPEINTFGAFAEVWVRGAEGAWGPRGAWPLGEAIGAAVEDPVAPPGWLAAALPQGVGVFVGRLEGGAWRGPEFGAEGAPESEAWVRFVGFGDG